ncbi:MAG TPA: hypothetical protein PKH93_11230, partial [Chitinophagales bacterium]|nr:hypothetical protein [Chitinophagales bacterium]
DNPNEWQLNCLKAGYYRIQMTDEITACEAEQIIFLNNPEPVYPIIDQYQLQADAGCGACTGSIVLQTVNGNPDLEHYQFAWSVCDPPESCNVVQQNNLCAGAYAVTALDPSTGCSSTSNLSIDYTVPNNDGIVTGINIDVYPTVYTNNTNVRLSLPAAGEVTVEVFNFNGVLVKKLVDKVFYQQGEFIIPDNTSTLNDGLYLYRLKVCETYKSDIGIKY